MIPGAVDGPAHGGMEAVGDAAVVWSGAIVMNLLKGTVTCRHEEGLKDEKLATSGGNS